MLLGVPREMRLRNAKETFLLDCKAVGLSKKTLQAYESILTDFIASVGDMLVRELGPDHVRRYIADLSDSTPKRLLLRYYAIIREWVRWMFAQNKITQRENEITQAPRLQTRSLLFNSFAMDKIARRSYFRLSRLDKS